MIARTALPPVKSIPNIPKRKATLRIADIDEPSICIVAPIGRTISVTSLGTPDSCATSILVGMVATDEHVPNAVTAGLNRCENITDIPFLPPPNHAYRGNETNMYTKQNT